MDVSDSVPDSEPDQPKAHIGGFSMPGCSNGHDFVRAASKTTKQTVFGRLTPKSIVSPSNEDTVRTYTRLQHHSFYCMTELYKKYDDRLKTFKTWPKSIPIRPDELVAAGFLYTGEGDRVACPWCQIVLREWETYDRAKQEHQRHSPKCLFVKMTMPSSS